MSTGNEACKIAVIGAGYVGLVTGAAFCERGHGVVCTTIDPRQMEDIMNGRTPFFEPGLDELVMKHTSEGRLTASMDNCGSVLGSDIVFIAVGTPSREDGSIDLAAVEAASADIGKALARDDRYRVVVMKSTVVPGTTRDVVRPILERESGKKSGEGFGLAMNPEFLREGAAVHDVFNPDRVIVGADDERSAEVLEDLYGDPGCPILQTDTSTAEAIKYASNAFLATKVTFANEMANLLETCGVDVYKVMTGVGLDSRIGHAFLRAGAGFGGSCFPKDVNALVAMARRSGRPARLLEMVLEENDRQPLRLVELAREVVGDLEGKRVALLGLSFKPDTDDTRSTRALPVYRALVEASADVVCHDPRAGNNFARLAKEEGLPPPHLADTVEEALDGARVAIFQSEWKEYRSLEPKRFVDLMEEPQVVDGRRAFADPEKLIAAGVRYRGIGWGMNREG